MDSLVGSNTELIGRVKSTTIESKEGRSLTSIMAVAGVAGLIMSLFIAFFIEYIEESKSRRKGK